MLEVLSARADFCDLSDVPERDDADLKACDEQSVVIMNTPGHNVNDVAELVFHLTLHGELEGTGRSSAFHTIPPCT